MLTGKYLKGIPKDSRAALPDYGWLHEDIKNKDRLAKVHALQPIAKELGCTLSQLSIAWCLKNPNVSTVILGASRVEQLLENLKADKVSPRLTPKVMERIDNAFGFEKDEEDD
jgi:aryl-alcohol dehydrogenase-like predicted oxidoreductase